MWGDVERISYYQTEEGKNDILQFISGEEIDLNMLQTDVFKEKTEEERVRAIVADMAQVSL